jgi:hypothetical protein
MPLHISGVTCPSSGVCTQLLLGVIAYVACVLTACRNRNPHAVKTHPTHATAPNINCTEPPEDGRVTPETVEALALNKQTNKSVSS